MQSFKLLFWFSGDGVDLVEIKREGLPKDTPPSKVYSWVLLRNDQVTVLTFTSMSDGQREFQEGSLVFTEDTANFRSTREEYRLKRGDPMKAPDEIKRRLHEIL